MGQTLEVKLVLDEKTKQELKDLNREIIREELNNAFVNFKIEQNESYSLRIKDVAKRLNISEVTVRRWFKKGDLKGKKHGGVIRFKPSEIDKALNSIDKLLYRNNKTA